MSKTQRSNAAALAELKREFADYQLPYEIIEFLSRGSYGAVCSGVHTGTGTKVAVKRVYTTTSEAQVIHILQSEFLCKRVLREVCLLAHFQHPNLLGLRDLVFDRSVRGEEKLYLITELMKTDLAQVIADRKINLTLDHIKYFMYHIILGLYIMHNSGVVHRDLHPGNILLSADNDVKICDFNLAREDTAGDQKTHYVTLRWYRAPELVMQFAGFSRNVDLWSAGCIMGEMFTRQPLFRGTTFYNQLNVIIEVVGTPNAAEVAEFSSQSANEYLSRMGKVNPRPWQEVIPMAPPDALDLINSLCQFNPAKRISAEQALRHPFFSEYFDDEDLLEAHAIPFHFDNNLGTITAMHDLLANKAASFGAQRQATVAPTASVTTGQTFFDDTHMPRAGSMLFD